MTVQQGTVCQSAPWAVCLYDSVVGLMLLKILHRLFTLMRAESVVCATQNQGCVCSCEEKMWPYSVWLDIQVEQSACVFMAFLECVECLAVLLNLLTSTEHDILVYAWECLCVWLGLCRCKTIVLFFFAFLQYVFLELSLFLIPHPTHTPLHTVPPPPSLLTG